MNFDISKLQRCLQLAKNGLGYTYPNPLVGCVIVHNNKVIGEGWHQKSGENHAEINAIESVKDKNLLPLSTLYVNLEPCSHYGKTPPCSLAILKHKIPRVVIGTTDFSSHVNGRGISFLKENGIEVIHNILADKCIHLNRRFFTNQLKKRPYIILKWAETANQYFAPNDNSQQWISSIYTKQLVHLWRSQENGILVGRKTLEIDKPQLNIRLWSGTNPSKYFLSNKKDAIYPGFKNILLSNSSFNLKNVSVALENILKKGTNSIIIEGGVQTLNSFINLNLWDEARVITSPTHWDRGIKAPIIKSFNSIEKTILPSNEKLTTYYNYDILGHHI